MRRERDSIRGKSHWDYGMQFTTPYEDTMADNEKADRCDPGVISTPYAVERAERIMRMVERQCILSFFAGALFMLVVVLMVRAL